MKPTTLKLLLLFIASLFSLNLLADKPPNGSVKIISMSHSGDACPQNSVSDMISPDGEAITLLFDNYVVEVESDHNGAAATKSCEILLTLQSPPGWEFGIFHVDIRGFAGFDPGTTGWQWATYWLNGRGLSGVANNCEGPYINFLACKQFYGPFSDDYIHTNTLSLDSVPFSSCSKTQNRIKIRTGAGTKTTESGLRSALLTVDSIDGELLERYELAWRRCDGGLGFIATCNVSLKNKWSTIRTFTAQGTGNSQEVAKQNALTNTAGRCELVRKSFPNSICDVANAQCSVKQQQNGGAQ